MYKKRISLVFIILIFFSYTSFSYCNNKADKKSLIVYEREKTFGYNENPINHLNELLYVFNESVSKISINDYKSGYMNDFDYVFVINIRNDIDNIDFLNDLSNFNNKIYWIGDQVENFLDFSSKYNISYNSKNNNITKLFYKNKEISK